MEKLDSLRKRLKSYGKVAIAYSGGCDSNFLLQVALDTLGKENVLAVFCQGAMISKEDTTFANKQLADVQHVIIKDIDVFSVDAFKNNDKKRCYFCKKEIMSRVISEANKREIIYILDGKNLDDEGVYRPGIQACKELGILSPIADSNMTKKEVRNYSKQLGIITHNKPANACLASRFDYGTILTKEKFELVDQAEAIFHSHGIHQIRVRVHNQLARIEVDPQEFSKVIKTKEITAALKQLGFKHITLDLEGITSGSYDK